MGYSNHFTGAITITPPLTRKQIRDAHHENFKDIRFRIVEQHVESEDGDTVTVRTTADAIIPLDMDYSGYNLMDEIQAIVDQFGEHEFAGFIEARWESGFGEPPSRFIVQDGRVVQIDAQYRWPGIWPDETDAPSSPAPRRMTAEQVAATLADMSERVGRGDSFDGSISYYTDYEREQPDGFDFDVTAAYRVGNSMGQGGMRVIRGEELEEKR